MTKKSEERRVPVQRSRGVKCTWGSGEPLTLAVRQVEELAAHDVAAEHLQRENARLRAEKDRYRAGYMACESWRELALKARKRVGVLELRVVEAHRRKNSESAVLEVKRLRRQLNRVRALSDPITKAALEAYSDFEVAICEALLAHVEERERLLAELEEIRKGPPISLSLTE